MDNVNDYNGTELVIVSVAFLVLTYLSVFLRCVVRLYITRSFKSDDWFMLLSQINFTLSCGFILRGVHYGMGHHNLALPQDERIQGLKYQALATLVYVSNMMFIKLSLAIFLLRIAVKKRYIWTLRISMVVVSIWSTAIFFYEIFQCAPVEAQWDFTIDPQKCASGTAFVAAAYSISVMSIVSDWMYAIMPIFMIWAVQMNTQKKVTVGFVLSMGVFASIATIVRLKYLAELSDYSDNLYSATTAMVWTLIEPGIAIMAASLITLRPLLRAMNFKGFESDNPYTNDRYGTARSANQNLSLRDNVPMGTLSNSITSGPRKENKMNSLLPRRLSRSFPGAKVLTNSSRSHHHSLGDSGSEEYILQGRLRDSGIKRTVDITVSHDAGSVRNQPDV